MSDERPRQGLSTRAIRAASRAPRVTQKPTTVPIYQTATFASGDAEELAAVLGGEQPGYAYSRIDNPTVVALGDAVAELHDAESGIALATGMAAIHAAFLSLVHAGDRVLIGQVGYGTTRTQAIAAFGRLGVDIGYVDTTDASAVEAALAARPTRILHVETIANPTCVVADVPRLADLAHRQGALLTVDNTFASPAVCRPLDHGADLVMESATKYLSGHSDVMAGAVVGSSERIERVRSAQIDTGATLGPFAAFLVLRGIATLAVRMERQSRTAMALATFLERQDGVHQVTYPGLATHPQAEVAARILDGGGAMLSVDLAGGRDAGRAFFDALTIPERTASLGSVHTMVVHPPSSSHRALDSASLAAAGITEGLLRISVGLEDEADLLADFGAALEAARATRAGSAAASGI
ncbi:MAG TPA: aminotransferase class I/II-fold pyridoxal phosphate-dependent enzyme [Candidatus Limnocylindrales bacterium]|nr:aminotransferase class I/II-fold pyridoxal phosphate-dependent enzyme [Candidatus Limnocylindrales bacterium]